MSKPLFLSRFSNSFLHVTIFMLLCSFMSSGELDITSTSNMISFFSLNLTSVPQVELRCFLLLALVFSETEFNRLQVNF